MTRKERIEQMENLFDQSNEVIQRLKQAIADFQALQPTIDELDNYYKTNWRSDFEADEKGKLPADLKRGVLSEDGLWDLLEEYQRLDECIGENEVRPRLTHTPHVNSQKDDARVKLRTMGASWFISYAYYNLYDKSHRNWEKAKTMQPRLSSYNNGAQQYMKTWISMVLDMNCNKLKKNEIGLTSEDVKRMAQKLLIEMEKNG